MSFEIIGISSLIGLMLAMLIHWCVEAYDEYNIEKLEKQKKVDDLKCELKELKGCPFVAVHDVEVGEIISASDDVYICLGISPNSYERIFFNVADKEIIKIKSSEMVRKRKDLEEEFNKIFEVAG